MGISGVTGGGADDARNRTVTGGNVIQPGGKRLADTFSEMICDRKEEFYVKVKNGTMEPSIPIGAGSYTEKEWDKILKRFDAVQEALREAAGLETDEAKERSREKAADKVADVTDTVVDKEEEDEEETGADLLLAQYVTCTYPAEDPEEEDDVYIIIYDSEGIRCLNKTTGQYEWSIRFTDECQLDKVKTIMGGLSASDDLASACREGFWQKCLEDLH